MSIALGTAAALAVALLVLAVLLRPERGDALTAELDTALTAAQSNPSRADPAAYLNMLRGHLEREPRDARAWVIYARVQAETGHFAEAAHAYERGLALSAKVSRDPAVWCEYADALGMTRGADPAAGPGLLRRRVGEGRHRTQAGSQPRLADTVGLPRVAPEMFKG